MSDSTSLASEATAVYVNHNVKFICSFGCNQRLTNDNL